MNYTLKQLQERVNQLIENQGEDAHCAAWIYTKEDCHLKDENGDFDYDHVVETPRVLERIFDDVGNIDYIYQVIQECVDEVVEEQFMQQQQELVWFIMSFVSNFSSSSVMNQDQLDRVKENYANLIVDGMDVDTLCTFAIDTIMHNMESWDEQDLKEEVVDLYDQETWDDLTA